MKTKSCYLVALLSLAASLHAAETNTARPLILMSSSTNFTTRYITNVINVSMPNNVFVDEYRTNWVRRDVTNTVDLFKTNWITRTKTNVMELQHFQTNYATAYRTNITPVTATNWSNVLVTQTNWVTRPVTNIVNVTNTVIAEVFRTNVIMAYQTNYARAYQTNYRALTFTNWETVHVMKTNWITRPITNTVEIDLPGTAPVVAAAPAPAPAAPAATLTDSAASAVELSQKLEFGLTHLGAPNRPGQYPVRLVLASSASQMLPVFEWRVEKVDGTALVGGSRPEFTGALPAGTYRVTARLRADDGSIRSVRGNTEIKADGSEVRTPAISSGTATASR